MSGRCVQSARSHARLVAALLAAALAVGVAAAESATLYRDRWGVPHIYADSAEAAAWAHGWAQAEDRLDDVLRAYLEAEGRAASVLGPEWIERDFVARVARHAEIARARFGELDPLARRLAESFVAGVRAYMAEHPDAVPAWATPPEPYQVVALYRMFVWAWPWGQARGDLARRGSHVDDGRGSNAWVVGPRRSAEGGAIALIDPHLSWEPVSRFYESHVHGGPLHFYGFSIIGTPIMALGHTDVFALAATTGGPDCADVYEERLHPEEPLRYRYDEAWRPVRVESIEIDVRTPAGTRVETRQVERTHHGPILAREADRAFAAKTAYDDEVGLYGQWMRMVLARNLGEFLEALAANQALPQNLLYADVQGHTYYVRAGRVPIRPPDGRWSRPVPGWTSATEWRGIHELPELVQILNPPSGFMQNCNVSPDAMMPRSPLTADRYPSWIFNSRPDRWNSRGRRALELLEGLERMTLEDALRVAVDTRVVGADVWQRHLVDAYAVRRRAFPRLEPAVGLLEAWDGRMDVDSRAAALFREWMRACRRAASGVPSDLERRTEPLARAEQLALLHALVDAVDALQSRFGRIDVAWGDVHRARRGEHTWPVGGCRADGISTLRSVRGADPDGSGISWVEGGQFATTVVLLRPGDVRSYSATPYGQSNDSRSPHYVDQGLRLFSRGELKPTWYAKEELLRNLASERTFDVPAAPDGR